MSSSPVAGATRYAGSRVKRVEDARLLTGRGTYVDDILLPGMLHVCFVRSPYARARIESIDCSGARALDGVREIYAASDLNPGAHEMWYTMMGRVPGDTPRPPLAEEEVRFVGDPVAMVVAENRYIAEDAADLVVVNYQPLTPVVDLLAAEGAADLVHGSTASNVLGGLCGAPSETVEKVFETASHVVVGTVDQQAQAACPMEGRGMIASFSAPTGELTIYSATQAPHEVRAFCARLLGVPEGRVRVVMRDTGGGFGQKVMVSREEAAVVLAAVRLDAPVKWVEDRRENLMTAGQARHEHGVTRMAFDAECRLQAVQIDFLEDAGAYPIPWPVGVTATVGALFPGPYRVPHATYSTKSVYTNTPGKTAYRGPWVFESLARELMLDRAARQMGIDPADLRRRNLLSGRDLPYTNPNGMAFSHMDPLETFERALDAIDYARFREDQAAGRAGGRYLGVGICAYVEPTTPMFGIFGTEAATIRVEPSGKVNVYIAGGSSGNSLETTAVQLTADALGVDIEDVTTIHGDTALTGYGAGTGGSRSGSMIAGAVGATAAVLRERMVSIAAHRLEAAPEDIELRGSMAMVRGTPARSVTLAEIAEMAYFQSGELPPGIPPGLEATERYRTTGSNWANATHVCTCEVDIATGRVRLLRYIVSEDCGPMINPNIVEGQIAGGVVQGIAGVLFEHLAVDEDGNPMATTFMDYLLPTTAEVPDIEYVHVVTPGPGPGGYKGVGEGGVLGAVGATTNAVADALAPLGVTVERLPLAPAEILGLLEP